MNKKLIALAVAGACAAPVAMAQTANPVTLYGRVYATFESVEASGGTAADVVRRNRVSNQASLLGVRGTEDLGGGLKAFFQLETTFKPDQNDTTFADRNSGVGLQGAWGSVLMGRWDTPYKTTSIAVDPYGDLTLGGITAANNGSGARGVQAEFDRRDQNVVQYWSPNIAGFAFRVSYSANEARTATANPRSNGASLTWTGGPIYVGYAYHELYDTAYGGITPPKQTANAIFGSVEFGPIKIGANYDENKRDGSFTGGAGISKQKSWLGNIVWTIGNNQLSYQHQNAKGGDLTTVANPDCKVDAVGWQYNFSKRTFFLAQYVKIDNNETATCNFGSNTLAIAAGQDPKGISLGLRHIF
ncbi:MAG TPA: porin [Usitatibacter sp.]|nr:porin [Usitatibacter sp.]